MLAAVNQPSCISPNRAHTTDRLCKLRPEVRLHEFHLVHPASCSTLRHHRKLSKNEQKNLLSVSHTIFVCFLDSVGSRAGIIRKLSHGRIFLSLLKLLHLWRFWIKIWSFLEETFWSFSNELWSIFIETKLIIDLDESLSFWDFEVLNEGERRTLESFSMILTKLFLLP